MALTITQQPAGASLAQSPMIFTVYEDTGVIQSSSFQYVCDLYYWSGSLNQSGSTPQYILTKYPNTSNRGIFDVSNIINSVLQDPLQTNPSNVYFVKGDFYWQYVTGSTFPTGSHVQSSVVTALDGYQVFPEAIGDNLDQLTPLYPFLTDGPVTQSRLLNDCGDMGVYVGTYGGEAAAPTVLHYSASYEGVFEGYATFALSGSASSSNQIQSFPIGPNSPNWPLPSGNDDADITIVPYAGDDKLNGGILFQFQCNQKYPNVRIKWKNRFGQFDFYNFNLVSRESFSTVTRTYQPQLGSWSGTSLAYQSYETSKQNYVSDSAQSLQVNTNYLSQEYNDIFKQLLVSDEIYWIYDEDNCLIKPLTIKTSTIQFKTGVVDKLIQYTIDFDLGQNYKLIL